MSHSRLENIKIVALAVSIVIVLSLFVNLGIKTFYPGPEYEDFCPREKQAVRYTNAESCEAAGGMWFEDNAPRPVPAKIVDDEEELTGWCDIYFNCQKDFNNTRDLYNRNVFIILVITGLMALGIGWLVNASLAVSSGFVFGGVLLFLIGTMRYWSGMQDYLRFIILGIALAVLIWIGYTRLNRNNKKK